MKHLLKLVLAGTIIASLAGCSDAEATRERAKEVTKTMTAAFPEAFSKLEFEEAPPDGQPASTLVFKGKDSTIVALENPEVYDWSRLGGPTVSMTGLARTNGGRWFTFDYVSAVDTQDPSLFSEFVWPKTNPCLDEGCRLFESKRPLSLEEAKRWFYDSDQFTPDRYRALFHEDAPPKRVPA